MTLGSDFEKIDNEIDLDEKINLITKYQKPYIAKSLKMMSQKCSSNVKVICDYIFAEQNEFNIKESKSLIFSYVNCLE